jgi:hypothetical protein
MWNTPPTPDKRATTINAQKANGKKAKINKLDKSIFIICSNRLFDAREVINQLQD